MKRYLHLLLTLLLLSVCTVGGAQTTVFNETFDHCNGTGGNDGKWSGKIAASTTTVKLDNTTWITSYAYGGNKCVKLGTSKGQGSATTPTISLTGNGTLTFKAGAWKGDATTLNISAYGAKLSKSSVTLADSKFTDYSIDITNATGSVTITFTGLKPSKTSKGRFFLDEVKVTKTSTKTATQLTFTNTGDKTYTVGDENNAAVYSNPAKLTTTDGTAIDGTITYTSNNSNVASVESNGDVLVNTKATGSATITATYAGDDTYASSIASYNITVAPKLTGAGTEANPYTVADVIALNNADQLPSNSVYVKGIVSQVDELSTSYGNATYYISDDGTTTDQLEIFRGKYLNNAKFTSEDQLKAGWTVTVTGTPIYYNNKTLELNSGNYITSIVKPSSYTAATLPSSNFATSGNDSYATFSSDQVTFFPESDENMTFTTDVQKAYALGDMMELKTLETANTTIDGNKVSGYFVPANTGVLLKVSFAGGTSITYYKVTGKDDVAALTDNMLYPATQAMSELTNCYFYKLAYNDYIAKTGLGFYWGADNGAAFTAKTNGAYLAVPKSSTSAKSGFRFDGTTTGVNTINAKTTTNDVIYNIQGQRVGANYKGLVIVNGKKMMRK